MDIIVPFILVFLCLVLPSYAVVGCVRGREINGVRLTQFIFAGVISRILFVLISVIMGPDMIEPQSENNHFLSPLVPLVATLLLVAIYSQVIIKSLIRQSEIVSRFFLDSLPSQQLGVDLEYRQNAISLKTFRERKKALLTGSMQLGGLEGVLRWLVADLWIVVLGSTLITLSSFKGEYRSLFNLQFVEALLGRFTQSALLLIIACVMSSFPLIVYFSKGLPEEKHEVKFYQSDVIISIVLATILSTALSRVGSLSDYLVISIMSLGLIFLTRFILNGYSRDSRKKIEFVRIKDCFIESDIEVSEGLICYLDLPNSCIGIIKDDLALYLERSGVNELPNVVNKIILTFVSSSRAKISFGTISCSEEFAGGFEMPQMEERVLKTIVTGKLDDLGEFTNLLTISKLPLLSFLIKKFIRECTRFDTSMTVIQQYILYLQDSELIRSSNMSKMSFDQLSAFSKILSDISLLGHSYVPVEVVIMLSEMIMQEVENDDILKVIVRELICHSPTSIYGIDGGARVLSLEKIDGDIIGEFEIGRISYFAKELAEKNLSPLAVRVEDITSVALRSVAELLLRDDINVKFIDSETKLGANFYPLGIV